MAAGVRLVEQSAHRHAAALPEGAYCSQIRVGLFTQEAEDTKCHYFGCVSSSLGRYSGRYRPRVQVIERHQHFEMCRCRLCGVYNVFLQAFGQVPKLALRLWPTGAA